MGKYFSQVKVIAAVAALVATFPIWVFILIHYTFLKKDSSARFVTWWKNDPIFENEGEKRAWKLLKDNLPKGAVRGQRVKVRGQFSGKTYVISIDGVSIPGITELCVIPDYRYTKGNSPYPLGDYLLTVALHILHNEKQFLNGRYSAPRKLKDMVAYEKLKSKVRMKYYEKYYPN